MTIQAALLQGQKLLEDAQIAAPRLTAEVLLIHAISHEKPVDRAWLYAHGTDELRELWWIHYGRYLHERMQGKPTQYITGHQEFYGRNFRVTPDVLIPRPETEHLVEAALSKIASAGRVIDVGTGSGAIAVTLALEAKVHVVATDISPAAIAVARENAKKLTANVVFVVADLCKCFGDQSFGMVVSNPPYVPRADEASIQKEVREFEPPLALYGGDHGLEIYQRLIPEARRVLKPDGWLMMELGYAVVEPVKEMLGDWNYVEILSDLAGLPRVVMAQKPSE